CRRPAARNPGHLDRALASVQTPRPEVRRPRLMGAAADLARGRGAFDKHDWNEAHANLRAADARSRLEAEDLERLAIAAMLTGLEEESAQVFQRAHNAYLKSNETERAVRCAIHLIMSLVNRGDIDKAGVWMARRRLLLYDGIRVCGV